MTESRKPLDETRIKKPRGEPLKRKPGRPVDIDDLIDTEDAWRPEDRLTYKDLETLL